MSKQQSSGAASGSKKNLKVKKRSSVQVTSGIAHVMATFNNTIISITDLTGHVLAWSSAGKVNFSGSRKSSAYAATVAAQDVARAASAMGMRDVEVNLRGPGAGRESAVRGLISGGLVVSCITDTTPVAHNGCRPRKRRRV